MAAAIIADHCLRSLDALSMIDRGRVMTFVTKFMTDPDQPGLNLERIQSGPATYSARVSRDLRAILHRDGATWVICHVGHHDAAYAWADRHDVERHARTGQLQIVESIDIVRTVEQSLPAPTPAPVEAPPATAPIAPRPAPLFTGYLDDYLLALGLPDRWLPALRRVTNADQLIELVDHLPPDVADRIWDVAAGEPVAPPEPIAPDAPLAPTPDLQRSFYFADDAAELAAVLSAPMARWIAFLHPTQRALVERDFSGPAKVTGAAGTGKTVVALHRARHLARRGHRVWLTSFVTTLCANLARQLDLICTPTERERITVGTVDQQALALAGAGRVVPATTSDIRRLVNRHAGLAPAFDADFLIAEWQGVIDPQGITDWPAYRDADRHGRGQALGARQRRALWTAFEAIQRDLWADHRPTFSMLADRAAARVTAGEAQAPFDAVVVDEVQDLNPPKLRLIRAIAAASLDRLMLVGDAGQRIYPGGFSLSRLGIPTRGRATILRINYRTTEQIRRLADRLLGDLDDDLDGGREDRRARSLLTGPAPSLQGHPTPAAEDAAAVDLIRRWLDDDHLAPDAIGVFARTRDRITTLARALDRAGHPVDLLHDLPDDSPRDGIQAGTMHAAKGLEFKRVLIIGCDHTALPAAYALRQLRDPQDRDDHLARERRLLYVAMTRARDALHLSWQGTPSVFITELMH